MTRITVNDLQESLELNQNALANLLGDSGGWTCKHWFEKIGCKFTNRTKRIRGKLFKQKRIKSREYKCCFRDFYEYKWVKC